MAEPVDSGTCTCLPPYKNPLTPMNIFNSLTSKKYHESLYIYHSRFMHLAKLHLHLLSHDTSTALQLHFRVAHFPLQAQGSFSSLRLLYGFVLAP